MANYREIVTKTVLGKGKKLFTNKYTLTPEEVPTTILGCWIINHKFEGIKENDKIRIKGTSDVNIWYSYDNDTKTLVSKQTISYDELVNITRKRNSNIDNNEEVIVRSLSGPTCTKVDINNGRIEYEVEKELGIELVGDAKVRIVVDDNEDDWDEIIDEDQEQEIMNEIDESINENFINEKK